MQAVQEVVVGSRYGKTKMERLLVMAFIFCGIFEFGQAIMCYECNSAINSMCNEKVLPDNLKRNCSEHDRGVKHTLCRKIVQNLEYEINGHMPASRVIRTCGWDESKYKGACYSRSGYGGRQEVCSCTKDFCNNAASASLSTILLFSSLLTVAVKKLYA